MIQLTVIALLCVSAIDSQTAAQNSAFENILKSFQNAPVRVPIQPAGVPAQQVRIQQKPLAAPTLTAHFDKILRDAELEESNLQRQEEFRLDQQQKERERKIEKLEALRDLYTDFPEFAPPGLALPGSPSAAASNTQSQVRSQQITPQTQSRPAQFPQFQFKPQPQQQRPRPLAVSRPQPSQVRPPPISVQQIVQPVQQSRPQQTRPAPRPQPIRIATNAARPIPGKLFKRPINLPQEQEVRRAPRPQPIQPPPQARPAPQQTRPAPQPRPAPRPAPQQIRPAPQQSRPAPQPRPAPRPAPQQIRPAPRPVQQQTRPAPQQQRFPTFQEVARPVRPVNPVVQQSTVFGKQHNSLTSLTQVGIPVEPLVDEFTGKKPVADITRTYQKKNADGSFTFGYEGEDGSFKEETRGLDCVVRGKYGYIDPEGMRREYTYVSGNPCDPNAVKDDLGLVNPDDPESFAAGGYYDYERNVYVTPQGQEVYLNLKRKNQHQRRFQ